ncbi:MAG: hypothetical protein WBA61_09245 [Aequorivita sp.]
MLICYGSGWYGIIKTLNADMLATLDWVKTVFRLGSGKRLAPSSVIPNRDGDNARHPGFGA